MGGSPLPDAAVRKAREATQALIDAARVVLHDLRHNQIDLEHLLEQIESPGE